jgi:para-nitrobenzyl esterase
MTGGRFARGLVVSALVGAAATLLRAQETVSVADGRLTGIVTSGVRSFRRIPYAAPPVGNLRWRPPQDPPMWERALDASKYGPECPQSQYPDGSVYIRPMRELSESCLTLNVWTTAKAGDKQPVFVWIHGGALTRGSSTSDVRDGVPLAQKGIVVVSVNYRLGALGYMAHPELSAESPHHASGNYGVLDQIAALKWVKQNIAAFGGDPATVTIGGESAGSWSVNTLVASPLAKGLFIRAIGESGGRFTGTPWLHDDKPAMVSAENVGLALAKAVGAASLKELRALPVEKLIDVQGFRTQETVDGWVLPAEIRTIFAERKQNNVPVLVGQNLNEMTSLSGTRGLPTTMEAYHERIRAQYGDLATEFDKAYGVTDASHIEQALLAAGRDTVFSVHMRAWARATTATGSKAYLYLFSHVPPSPRRQELGAFHASELPYVFNALKFGDPREAGFAWTAADQQLSDQIATYWANFIKTGDPNGKGLPTWTPYDLANEPFLNLGDPVRSGSHLFKAELDLQDKNLKIQH